MRLLVAAASVAVLATLAFAAACVSLDGLAGGTRDAGTESAGEAATDATSDTGNEAGGDAASEGSSESGPSCTQTSGDSHNCGACGHDCLGAACTNGTCTPSLLVGRLPQPSCVAVDTLQVYWATRACPGGMMCIGAKSITSDAGAFVIAPGAADDFGVGWADCAVLPSGTLVVGAPAQAGFIDEFPPGATVESRFAYGTASVVALAVTRSGGIAWTTTNGWVYACGSTCNNNPTTIAAAQATPSGIATDGTTVYWTNLGDGTIASSPFFGDGGQVTVVAADAAAPSDIAVDDAGVYWVERTSGNVVQLPAGASTPLILSSGSVGADAIAIDARHVYWASSGGTVMRVDKDGGALLTLASGQPGPADLVVDSQWVYWANGVGDGGIYRVAK